MAVDMFMKIDDIKGESQDAAHKGEIDVYTWSWAVTQTGSSQVGGGSGTGRANVEDFTFTTKVDSSHAPLLGMTLKGKAFKTAVFTCRKAGDKPLEYLKITMSAGLISGITFSADKDDELQTATVTLNFGQVKFDYTPQNADGSGMAMITYAHDMQKNAPM
jgi:type VI secretion system secreted protein Hcp